MDQIMAFAANNIFKKIIDVPLRMSRAPQVSFRLVRFGQEML
jgi:hypothetical protein